MSLGTTTRQPAARPTTLTDLLRTGLIALFVASGLNLVLWALARYLLRLPLHLPSRPGVLDLAPASPGQIVLVTALAAVGATLVWGLLLRLTRWARPLFLILALLVLLLSFGPLLALPITPAEQIVLGLMHVTAAVAIVAVLLSLDRASG